MIGKRPEAAQSNLPLSTRTPPRVTPWPPMNLVAECITMSAPRSIGLDRNGVPNVLSISSGTPISWAIVATAGMSRTSIRGLPIVSPKNSFVFGRAARRKFAGSVGSTNVVSMPNRRSVWFSRLCVPP